MVNINVSNRALYTIIAIFIILIAAGITFALNSGNPAIHGHTSDEIQGGVGNLNCTHYDLPLASGFGVNRKPGMNGTTYCTSKNSFCVFAYNSGTLSVNTGGYMQSATVVSPVFFDCLTVAPAGSAPKVVCCRIQ